MINTDVVTQISKKYSSLQGILSERGRRVWAATEACAIGHGGVSAVSKATGISRTTIHGGIDELNSKESIHLSRQRKPGGGRKSILSKSPEIQKQLESLLEPTTRGDPESALTWTSKSTTTLSDELKKKGYNISQKAVCNMLHELGFSLQSNKKRFEGDQHPDRDAQFNYIYEKVKKFQKSGNAVISVDAKKKELVGNFKNQGKHWRPKNKPEEVNAYDFPDPEVPKATPYGVYDLSQNNGWVSVGISHDTAEFAVATIKKWWEKMGRKKYSAAKKICIVADSGGSNSSRSKLWKAELQKLADNIGKEIHVSHFPPGTSKWNKIEHMMFSYISINWKGRPLKSLSIIVNLIGNTKTKDGLEIRAELDKNQYPTGIEISDEEMSCLKMTKDSFHGEWNYIFKPRIKKC